MNKDTKERQKIYDKWHKDIYQINMDIDKSMQSFDFLHKNTMKCLGITSNTEGNLLDVACGKGLFLKALKEKNSTINLWGSDISSYAISVAKKIVDAKFSVDDGEKLSFKSNQFDYVTCLGGIEYYQNPVNGAKEINRVLKKGGKAVILVPNLMFVGYIWLALRYGLMPTHGGTDKNGNKVYDYNDEKFYTFRGWKDILEVGGLKIVSADAYSYVGNTRFANNFLLFIYNKIFKKFVPFNLANTFVFICEKQ